jgi:hypothetical protein
MNTPRLNNRFAGLDKMLRASPLPAMSLPDQEHQKRFMEQDALLARCKQLLDRLPGDALELQCLKSDLQDHLGTSSGLERKTTKKEAVMARGQQVSALSRHNA